MATRRRTTRRRATGRVYRCKGRTATGRIMKGYRLTRGGLVKVTGRKRAAPRKRTVAAKRRTTRRRRGNNVIDMSGLLADRRQLRLF